MATKKAPKLYTQEEFDRMQEQRDSTGYYRGVADTEAKYRQIKVDQVRAATELMEQAGRIMSRAGYMIGKINGDNSR